MLLDEQALFSDQQAITGSAASTNFINLGERATVPHAPAPLKRDLGGANKIEILIHVTEDFGNLTSLTATIQVDDNASFSSPKSAGTTGAVAVADLKAGKILPLTMMPVGADEQYVRLSYTVAGSNANAGKVTAGIVAGIQTNG